MWAPAFSQNCRGDSWLLVFGRHYQLATRVYTFRSGRTGSWARQCQSQSHKVREIMGASNSQQIDEMHLADRCSSGWMPWRASTPNSQIDKEQDYFCTATWGTMWLWNAPQFASFLGAVNGELAALPRGHLVGYTVAIQPGVQHFIGETITVWHAREHMVSFYRSGTHERAMQAMKGKIDFRARRVWVKGADLPPDKTHSALTAFVSRVKNGEFPAAVKATHPGAAATSNDDDRQ